MLKGGATAAYVGGVAVRSADADRPVEGRAPADAGAREAQRHHLSRRRFSREAADYLDSIGVPAFKTGSGEMTNIPLQRHIARKGKPMIVSTGMSTPEEIEATVRASTTSMRRSPSCTASTYPTPFEHVQLGCIAQLQAKRRAGRFLRSHARHGDLAAAVAGGANIFEKHFTASRRFRGPISRARWSPKSSRRWSGHSRGREVAGRDEKIQPGEQDVRNMALHSVVSIRDIAAGATIGKDDVWVKRPAEFPRGSSTTSSGRRRSGPSRKTRCFVSRCLRRPKVTLRT
jgi:N-acetylneuraminate synthase